MITHGKPVLAEKLERIITDTEPALLRLRPWRFPSSPQSACVRLVSLSIRREVRPYIALGHPVLQFAWHSSLLERAPHRDVD